MKKVLAICDGEEKYLRHMADYLEEKGRQLFTIRAFTDGDQLQKFVGKNETELLLIAENAFREEMKELPIAHMFVLNESGSRIGGDTENINKYQSSERIFQTVIGTYMEEAEAGRFSPRIAAGNRMKIIGYYSPVGRCLQTTFALGMGQLLAKKHKTLYLNFESYSGFGQLIGQDFAVNITDVLYYFDCEREKLAYRLESMIHSINGLDYIPPAFSYQDLAEINGRQWLELFWEIEKITAYEYLVLDLSEQVRGLFDVLRECFRIFTMVKADAFAEAKMRQYEAMIQSLDYGDVIVKTKKMLLPEFHRLPSGIDQLTQGGMGAYMKKAVEENIYECQG